MMMNCVRRRSHESVKMKTGMMMTLVVMMMVIHHTSADLSTLIHNTARSLKERPERSALEPPTVTSLKPSDRNKSGGRGLGGISVQGEQSGSHIPPVVASRSPSSSSSSRDYKNRYMHINRPVHQPRAPVATASSRSRSGNAGILTGRRPHSNPHHAVPAPMPHLVNGTTSVSIPRESFWVPPVSYAPPPPRHSYGSSGYAPIARSYPGRPRIHEETMVPEPSYVDGQLQETNPYHGGGVWGQTEDEPTGGLWGDTRRHPSYSQGHPRGYGLSVMEDSLRTDTFGHRLSEDLSHLSSDYPPHRSNSRRTQVHHPIHSADVSSPSRGSSQPQEEDIHIINQNHNRPRNGNRNLNVEGREEPSFPQSSGSGTSSSVRKSGMAPTTYGSIFNADRTHPRKVHPKEEVVTHDELPETRHQGAYDSQGNDTLGTPISAADEDDRQPLTLYEIWHMKNMSTWDEFVEFLQRKGIKVGQVLSYMNEGATREEMIEFLDRPDLTTTPQQSQVFDDQLSDGDVREITDSAELFIPAPSVPVSTTEEMDDGTLRHAASKSREERKKNRKKNKNKKRGRKNRENQKRRRKNKQQTIPDILFTTVIPPTDLSKNGSMNQLTSPETNVTIPHTNLETSTTPYSGLPSGLITQEPPAPTVALLSTTPALTEHSVVTENSTNQPIQSQLQTQTVPLEQTTAESPQNFSSEFDDTIIETTLSEQMIFNESAVLEQPDLSSRPLSVTPPSATPVPITGAPTIRPIISPITTTQKITTPWDVISPALLTTEFTPTTKTTALPVSMGPRAGSLTLPPTSKPSEVSIILFTVRTVPPKYETHEDTRFEDITPIRKRQKHRTSHKRERKLHHQRMHSQPSVAPKKIEEDMVIQTPFKRKERKDNYTFPVRGFMIITGIMGALAVFTLVVLISYAIIKCSKQPVVNNYQVSEQKAPTQ